MPGRPTLRDAAKGRRVRRARRPCRAPRSPPGPRPRVPPARPQHAGPSASAGPARHHLLRQMNEQGRGKRKEGVSRRPGDRGVPSGGRLASGVDAGHPAGAPPAPRRPGVCRLPPRALTSTSHRALELVADVADWRPVVLRKTCCFFRCSSHVRNFSCSAWNSRTTSPWKGARAGSVQGGWRAGGPTPRPLGPAAHPLQYVVLVVTPLHEEDDLPARVAVDGVDLGEERE